ncbi:hypothetical protein LSH36_1164g00034 [Paralvinella palmiformis]|uniref:Uncharacterized protein n=1 Tax=Paralvinella palmiformis TaxID=53620 RepID=A0AAD9IV23_9ANNE|nr:hypothetical protein LSH36_1164g00034 [Paralvinella palmiformis]
MTYRVHVSSVKTPSSQPQPQQPQPIVHWSNPYNNVKYKDILIRKLQELGPLNISAARSTQIQIDGYICSITEEMVEAAKLAGCIPKKQYSPKKYWCPELSRLRDSKRFWWHLWVSNGRPRTGEVFKCCRRVKKASGPESGSCEFTNDQLRIKDTVFQNSNILCAQKLKFTIYSDKLEKCTNKLKRNSSPGMDSVTSEYLINRNSSHLCSCIASLYTMLESNCVPTCFNTGVIIPILKKATLDPNIPEHYRPITLSSTYSKLFESIIIPDVTLKK